MLLPIVTLVFLCVLCLLAAAALWLAERQSSPKTELKRRLQHLAKPRAADTQQDLKAAFNREATRAERLLSRFAPTRNLSKKLEYAGMVTSAATFVAVTAAAALLFAALAIFKSGMLFTGLLAGGVVPAAAAVFLRSRIEKRNTKFTEQFPDALSIISRSLRAGHSFTTAVQLVGQEVPAPVGSLFRTAYDQQQLGLRIADALAGMNQKIDSLDLRFFTTVVAVNTEVGGNLAEVLDKLGLTIRDRLKIRRQVQVYTAQGRMSGYVLGALPILAFGMFSLLNPEYERALIKEPMWLYILLFAGLMQVVGLLVIRQIIRIRI